LKGGPDLLTSGLVDARIAAGVEIPPLFGFWKWWSQGLV